MTDHVLSVATHMALPFLPLVDNSRVLKELGKVLNLLLKSGHFNLLDNLKLTVLYKVDVFVKISLIEEHHVLDARLRDQIRTEIH